MTQTYRVRYSLKPSGQSHPAADVRTLKITPSDGNATGFRQTTAQLGAETDT